MDHPDTLVSLTHSTYRARNVFPGQLVAEGYYDLITQVPVLSRVEAEDFEAFRNDPSSVRGRRVGSLTAHEITHWADHVGTVWGQRRLAELFSAMEALADQQETTMWRIAHEASLARRDRLSEYYTVVWREVGPGEDRPWRTELTCGYEYGADGNLRADRPILFYRFHGYENGPICRVPFSVAALLEANATWAELLSIMDAVGLLDDIDRLIELRQEGDALQRRLYDPRLGVYALSAHHAANKLGLNDSARGYHSASLLSTLALNLPEAAFDDLRIPESLAPFGDRIQHLVTMRDRGLAFYLLSVNAPPYPLHEIQPYTSEVVLSNWIESVLEQAGLPTIAEIEPLALDEMRTLHDLELTEWRRRNYHQLAQTGLEVFASRGLAGIGATSISRLLAQGDFTTPPILLGDDSVVAIGRQHFDKDAYHLLDRLEAGWQYSRRSEEFVAACRP